MSYDLYFLRNEKKFDLNDFQNFFKSRPNFTVNDKQALYQNGDTGVYFYFEYVENTENNWAASFSMNYMRPSIFALEAEYHVFKFTYEFDFKVDDTQIDGMGDDAWYSKEEFLSGWNKGNQLAVKSLYKPDGDTFTLPRTILESAWKWNINRKDAQSFLGQKIFIPLVIFMNVDGKAKTTIMWPGNIPQAFPAYFEPDYILFMRGDDPQNTEDFLVEYSKLKDIITSYRREDLLDRDAYLVVYEDGVIPQNIIDFTKNVKSDVEKFQMIAIDKIVDEEYFKEGSL